MSQSIFASPGSGSHFSLERLREVERFAETRGLARFVYCGYTYIMDGGKTAHRERGDWWSSFGCSSRKATVEETELWLGLGGPT
jgi:hypothetical protein